MNIDLAGSGSIKKLQAGNGNGVDRYRAVSHSLVPIGGGNYLVSFRDRPQAEIIPDFIAKALTACRGFRDREGHIAAIQICLGENSNELLARRIVDDFIAIGYLVSDRSLWQRSSVAKGKREIATLGIVTHNRPVALERCLHSFLQNTQEYGREVEFVISDDSDYAAHAIRNMQVIDRAINRGARIRYLGSAEKQAFATCLAASGIPAQLASFAMWGDGAPGPRIGANRNCLLLAAAGRLMITLDDDIDCKISAAEAPDRRLAVTSGYPWILSFYRSRTDAIAAALFAKEDFIAAHERFLGTDIGQCISHFESLASPDDVPIREHLMSSLEEGRGSIAFTQSGVYGDCGFGSPSGYLSARGLTRANLLESAQAYGSAWSSRAIRAGVERVTISDHSFCMGYALGLDNRSLLPPFSPAGRNEDGVFGYVLRKCFPDRYACHLPQAVLHNPLEQRHFREDAIWSDGSTFQLTDILKFALAATGWMRTTSRPHNSLASLGRSIADLASLPVSEFWRLTNTAARHIAARHLQSLERLLDAYGSEPAYWAQDVRRFCNALQDAITEPDFLRPPEIPGGDHQRRMQDYIRRYGELLAAWSEVVSCAKDLQRRSILLGTDLRTHSLSHATQACPVGRFKRDLSPSIAEDSQTKQGLLAV
jgi:hypothetical protein